MRNSRMVTQLLTIMLLMASIAFAQENVPAPTRRLLAHNVYFGLNDNSAAAKEKLVAACRKYLTGHPGQVSFAVGVLAKELDRPVNDRDFDVSLHIVFESKQAHDRYQSAERHQKFIEENSSSWKKVRVFDSYVEK